MIEKTDKRLQGISRLVAEIQAFGNQFADLFGFRHRVRPCSCGAGQELRLHRPDARPPARGRSLSPGGNVRGHAMPFMHIIERPKINRDRPSVQLRAGRGGWNWRTNSSVSLNLFSGYVRE